MERSFKAEVESLKLGDGETFHGEGILAVTKALLQSGVSYVGGYQGAPVSHMMDVLNDARDILDELGVHVETNASEAGAAAMLGASINYPMRGAVTWKSTVGTNVASDALSNLASAGVKGGARDHHRRGLRRGRVDHPGAHPRLRDEVADVAARPAPQPADHRRTWSRRRFELSEASSTPVFFELRIRACHVHGSFATRGQPPAGHLAQARRWTTPTSTTAASACRPPPTRRRSTRSRCAGRRRSSSSARTAQRDLPRARMRTSASSARAACTT